MDLRGQLAKPMHGGVICLQMHLAQVKRILGNGFEYIGNVVVFQ